MAEERSPVPLSNWLFALAVVVGVFLRTLVAQSVGGRLDSDQAIVYLMARHGGGGWLFWGQPYGGTLLQVTAAGAFSVFGPSVLLLQAVEALWWLVAALLLRTLGARLWGVFAGDLAGALLLLPGPVLLWLTVRDPGFYGPTVALGVAVLLLALTTERLTPRLALALGVLAGLAVWTSPMGAAFVVPAGLYALLRRGTARIAMLASGLVGLVPLLIGTARNTGAPASTQKVPLSELPTRVNQAVFDLLPSAWVGEAHSKAVLIGLAWCLLVAGAAAVGVVRRSWALVVLAAVAALSVVVVAVGLTVVAPVSLRYAALLAPVLLLLLAGLASRLGAARWSGWLLVLVLTGLTFSVSDRVTHGFRSAAGNHWAGEGGDLRRNGNGNDYARAGSTDLPALVAHLRSLGVTAVYADYWVAYLIDAQSGEQIIAAPLVGSRWQPYVDRAETAARTTIVVFGGLGNEAAIRGNAALPPYRVSTVAEFTVFVFDGHVPSDQLPRGLY